jgi:hypothetical protein
MLPCLAYGREAASQAVVLTDVSSTPARAGPVVLLQKQPGRASAVRRALTVPDRTNSGYAPATDADGRREHWE